MSIVLLDKAGTDKLITSIAGRGAKLDKDIHQAACSAVSHIIDHGDITLLVRLIAAMPKSGRKQALIKWSVAFSKLEVNDNKATKADTPFLYNKAKANDLTSAMETPFWDFTATESSSKPFIVADYLGNVSKRLQTALKTESDPIIKAQIESVLAALGAAHV
jgi:hypothetical protein